MAAKPLTLQEAKDMIHSGITGPTFMAQILSLLESLPDPVEVKSTSITEFQVLQAELVSVKNQLTKLQAERNSEPVTYRRDEYDYLRYRGALQESAATLAATADHTRHTNPSPLEAAQQKLFDKAQQASDAKKAVSKKLRPPKKTR